MFITRWNCFLKHASIITSALVLLRGHSNEKSEEKKKQAGWEILGNKTKLPVGVLSYARPSLSNKFKCARGNKMWSIQAKEQRQPFMFLSSSLAEGSPGSRRHHSRLHSNHSFFFLEQQSGRTGKILVLNWRFTSWLAMATKSSPITQVCRIDTGISGMFESVLSTSFNLWVLAIVLYKYI